MRFDLKYLYNFKYLYKKSYINIYYQNKNIENNFFRYYKFFIDLNNYKFRSINLFYNYFFKNILSYINPGINSFYFDKYIFNLKYYLNNNNLNLNLDFEFFLDFTEKNNYAYNVIYDKNYTKQTCTQSYSPF